MFDFLKYFFILLKFLFTSDHADPVLAYNSVYDSRQIPDILRLSV